jgi:nodulation protein E
MHQSMPQAVSKRSPISSNWDNNKVLCGVAMDHDRVVVTGLGCVSALGHDVDEFWSSLATGRCGLGPIDVSSPDLSAPAPRITTVGGAIPSPDPRLLFEPRRSRKLDRFSILALVAAQQALAQSGLSMDRYGGRTGCIIGVGIAGWEAIEESYRQVFLEGLHRTNIYTVPRVMPSAPASQVSMALGVRGPVFATSSACASSNHAIATALWLLRSGVMDAALVGGTDAPLVYGVLHSWEGLRVLAPDTCRPFDKNRKGVVLADGAGVVVMERASHARARGAFVLAEIAGAGMSADAAHLVAPTMDGPTAAIRACLADARLNADDVDYINAHGTGTVVNDSNEIKVIKSVFGEHARRLSISSTKSMHGHAMGASSALELIATIRAIQENLVPPTVNIEQIDPECDLDVTPNCARERPIRVAISNAFAFGGTNAIVAIRRFEP